ncbi:hypothetical protein ABQX22_11490 [Xanthomonas sp. WHRI 1810A]|uniref:hypothetical protein n=1 Tax=Xanthomonas sp. WHRI 1810A TaxID=3161565 RepID=UPI0032E8D6BB
MSNVIVNAGCMLFFAQGVAAQLKKDVLDSTLYTQLAATKKHDRFSATKQWKEVQLNAMTHFGWVMQSVETFNQPAPRGTPETVWGWMAQVLPLFMPAAAFAEARTVAHECYTADADQHGFDLFACQVSAVAQSMVTEPAVVRSPPSPLAPDATPVVLQLGFLAPTATLYLVSLSFTRRQPLTSGFLFDPMDASDVLGNIELTFRALRLQDMVYSLYRRTIDEKLQDRRSSLVAHLFGQGEPEGVNP